MRRSGGITEAIPIVCKFGTSLEQIEELRERMLDFVKSEKREYQSKIITELRDIPNMHSVKLNVVFFYKSNWQNELVRLQRRNKFMCALMCTISELEIESPNMRWPGQKADRPMYLQSVQSDLMQQTTNDTMPPPNNQESSHIPAADSNRDPQGFTEVRRGSTHSGILGRTQSQNAGSIRGGLEHGGGSIRGKRVDFSLGVKDIIAMDDSGDVFDDRPRRGLIPTSSLRRVEEEEEDAKTTSRRQEIHNHMEGLMHRRRTSSHGGSRPGSSIRSHRYARHSNEVGDVTIAIPPTQNRQATVQDDDTEARRL